MQLLSGIISTFANLKADTTYKALKNLGLYYVPGMMISLIMISLVIIYLVMINNKQKIPKIPKQRELGCLFGDNKLYYIGYESDKYTFQISPITEHDKQGKIIPCQDSSFNHCTNLTKPGKLITPSSIMRLICLDGKNNIYRVESLNDSSLIWTASKCTSCDNIRPDQVYLQWVVSNTSVELTPDTSRFKFTKSEKNEKMNVIISTSTGDQLCSIGGHDIILRGKERQCKKNTWELLEATDENTDFITSQLPPPDTDWESLYSMIKEHRET